MLLLGTTDIEARWGVGALRKRPRKAPCLLLKVPWKNKTGIHDAWHVQSCTHERTGNVTKLCTSTQSVHTYVHVTESVNCRMTQQVRHLLRFTENRLCTYVPYPQRGSSVRRYISQFKKEASLRIDEQQFLDKSYIYM